MSDVYGITAATDGEGQGLPSFLVQAEPQTLPPGYGVVEEGVGVLVEVHEEGGQVLSLVEPSHDYLITLADGTGGGSGGGKSIFAYVADTVLGGNRVVRVTPTGLRTVGYASSDDPDGSFGVVGITVTDAVAGGPVTVQIAGEMTEPSWTWNIGPVWLGTNGFLTQTRPTTGVEMRLGLATSPTTVNIDLADDVGLGD